MSTWTEQDSLDLTVALVARDGYRMPLKGVERRAAVEQMIAAGLSAETIASRLCMGKQQLLCWAHNNSIRLPKRRQGWWVAVAQPSSAPEAKARSKAAREARVAA